MLEKREPILFDEETLHRGYRSCRASVKKHLKGFLWPISNVAGENRQGLDALLTHLLTTLDLLDLESTNGLSLEVWHEIRDDLSDAFRDQYANVELAALVDTARRFSVPREYLFDPLRGADLWIRTRKFETFQELETFCSYIGGSYLLAAVPIIGYLKPDYELPAIACGKAIMLTQIMANCVNDMKHNRVFLAQDDLKEYEVDVSRMKMRREHPSLRHVMRLYASRVEKLFQQGVQLVGHLDFDGKRTLTTVLAWHWKLLTRIQRDPESVLQEEGVLSKKEMLGLQSRHLLGMNQYLPILPVTDEHH